MKRAFALYIMLAVLALLGAFALVASRVVAASMRLTRQAQEAHTREIRLDGLIRTLREDVWAASSLQVTADNLLKLTRGGNEILWTRHPDGVIARDADPARRWDGLGHGLSFARTDTAVILRVGDDTVVLVSQVRLANRGRP